MTYNGWKNWETWNVALWLGNNESLYRSAIEHAQSIKEQRAGLGKWRKLTAADARWIVQDLMPNGTPDFQSDHHGKGQGAKLYSVVQWSAIADNIAEMAFGS